MEGHTPGQKEGQGTPKSVLAVSRQKAQVRQRRARQNRRRRALLQTFQGGEASSSDDDGNTNVSGQCEVPALLSEALQELPPMGSSDEDRISSARNERRQELPRQNQAVTSPGLKGFLQGVLASWAASNVISSFKQI